MRLHSLFLFPVAVAIALTACSRVASESENAPSSQGPLRINVPERLVAAAWADSVSSLMSLEEQAAQLLMPALYATGDAATMSRLKWYAEDLRVGGILLLKGNAEAACVMTDTLEAIRSRLPYPAGTFLAIDAETGLGMRFSDAPKFPWNSMIDRRADSTLFYAYGEEIGREARIAGISMILGPVVDVSRVETPDRGVMRKRSLGSDQLRVSQLANAYAEGLENQGVAAVLKHFPGHGPTATDSHKSMPTVEAPLDEIYTVDLMPYREAVRKGISGIMVGHIWVRALDSVARPASFSPVVIDSLLRRDMGFNGLVLVDAVNMAGAKGYSCADAIMAGADIIIAPANTEAAIKDIMEALACGSLPESRIRESCRRVLYFKQLHGVNSSVRPREAGNLKERLHQKALPVISRLKCPD